MFTVIYRWRLDEEKLLEFQRGWAAVTRHYLAHADSLGSRLHQADDGIWVAYAQWPDRQHWRDAADTPGVDAHARELMRTAIIERFEPITMTVHTDLLRPQSGLKLETENA